MAFPKLQIHSSVAITEKVYYISQLDLLTMCTFDTVLFNDYQ